MATLKLPGRDHLILANRTILWTRDSLLDAFCSRVLRVSLSLHLSHNRVWVDYEFHLGEIFLEVGHENLELKVLFEICVHLANGLDKCLADAHMRDQIQVHALDDEQQQEVEHIQNVDAEVHYELEPDHVNFVLVKIGLLLSQRGFTVL